MTGSLLPDDALLDDPERLEVADRGQLLRSYAGAGARVRTAARAAAETGVGRAGLDGRPRAVLVVGAGVSRTAAEMFRAITGPACPVPVLLAEEATLPGWVGPLDIVVVVSASGRAERAVSLAEEAARRGSRLVTVAPTGSLLQRLGEQARATQLPVESSGGPARANLWSILVPLLVLADAIGLATVPPAELAGTADVLDSVAERCAPTSPVGSNAAKDLSLGLAGTIPLVWGTSPTAEAAASRLLLQLATQAKMPGLGGSLPDTGHDCIEVLAGPLVTSASDDIFADPFDSPLGPRPRLVLLRDAVEHPSTAATASAALALAERRGVSVSVLVTEAASPLQRLAELVALADLATTYLALATGVDPSATPVADELEARLAGDPA